MPRRAALLLCLTVASAQEPTSRPRAGADSQRDSQREALRCVRLLELPERRTEAWRRLAPLGAAALPPLCDALDDPRSDVAARAAAILGWLGPAAEPALARLGVAARRNDAAVAEASRWALAMIELRGTLLVEHGDNSVLVLAPDGSTRRKLANLRGPWHAQMLADDHVLVAEYLAGAVRELDGRDNQVWEFTGVQQAFDAERLADGNTLIAAGEGRVIEVDRSGKIVWQKTDLQRPSDADRLPDGNTLITCYEGACVLEVDPKGNIVWRVDGLERPKAAERLANGNTLIAVRGAGLVLEVDPAGRTVAKLEAPNAQNAHRLPDGNTIVAANTCFIEFDAKGKELWRRAGQASDFWRQ